MYATGLDRYWSSPCDCCVLYLRAILLIAEFIAKILREKHPFVATKKGEEFMSYLDHLENYEQIH